MCLLLLDVLLATGVPAKRRQRSWPTSPGHCARFRKPSAEKGCLGVDQAGQEQHCCLRGPRKRSLMGSYTRRLGLSVPVLVGTNNLQSRVHEHHHVRRPLVGCVPFNGRLLNESHLVLCRKWYAHKSQSHFRTNAGHHQLHHAPRLPEVRRTTVRTKRPSLHSPTLPFPSPLLPTSVDMSATGKFQRVAAATKILSAPVVLEHVLLLNGSAWSTEKKCMERCKGTDDIFSELSTGSGRRRWRSTKKRSKDGGVQETQQESLYEDAGRADP